MLSREEFIFTIGYDGPAAVVDSQAKKLYGKLSTKELAEKGFFRAAYSSALYSESPQDLESVLAVYNKTAGTALTVNSPLNRLFGVYKVDVKRSIIL